MMMKQGTVKWFNCKKDMDLLNLRAKQKTYLYTLPNWRKLVFVN